MTKARLDTSATTEHSDILSGLGADDLRRFFFDGQSVAMLVHEPGDGRILAANEAATRFYGYGIGELTASTLRDLEVSGGDEAGAHPAADETGSGHASDIHCHRLGDGTTARVALWTHEVELRGRRLALTTVFDITDRLLAEERQSVQAAYFRQLFENSPEGIVILDADDCIVEANKGFQAMFKYSAEEIRGRPVNELIVPPAHKFEATGLSDRVLEGGRVESETVRQTRDGDLIDVSVLGYPITLNGDQLGVYGIYRDITEHKRLEGLMAYQAGHDSLTDLLNRQEFERRLARLVREKGGVHSLLLLDLDQFKAVNELHGHQAGDELLRQVARLLRKQVRQSDLVARLGGDEFAVLLYGCDRPRAEEVGQQLLARIKEGRFHWNGHRFPMSASIGLVEVNESMRALSDVLIAAETAVFAAKKRGSNRIQTYDPGAREMAEMRGEISWITPINQAIVKNNFALFCQRMVPVSGGESPGSDRSVERFELLVRMYDGDGALVAPGSFIPTAERYNLMPTIDRWVISEALSQIARGTGSKEGAGSWYSINLSGTTINSEDISAFVAEQFQRTGVSPHGVCFEITETAAITNLGKARQFIHDMKRLGVSIALDDFGSGMSSFSYLKSLSIDYLKIDGQFVKGMLNDPMDHAIVDAVNRLGHVLGIATVAEFVEDEDILRELGKLGVDFAQGYAVHRPEPWLPESGEVRRNQ